MKGSAETEVKTPNKGWKRGLGLSASLAAGHWSSVRCAIHARRGERQDGSGEQEASIRKLLPFHPAPVVGSGVLLDAPSDRPAGGGRAASPLHRGKLPL